MFRRFPLTLFCVALIWYLCLFKPPSLGFRTFTGFDKFVHISMYLGTCSVFWLEYFRSKRSLSKMRLFLIAVLAPILMSGIIELVQENCTTYRGGDWWDFAANSFGVLLALAGAVVYGKFRIRK